MNRKNTLTVIIVVLGLLIILFCWRFFKPTGNMSESLDVFAKCLASKEVTMYGTERCSWCQKEKANFGAAFKYVSYVECSKEPQRCLALKIEAMPTWVLADGQKIVGYQGLENLARLSGCVLAKDE